MSTWNVPYQHNNQSLCAYNAFFFRWTPTSKTTTTTTTTSTEWAHWGLMEVFFYINDVDKPFLFLNSTYTGYMSLCLRQWCGVSACDTSRPFSARVVIFTRNTPVIYNMACYYSNATFMTAILKVEMFVGCRLSGIRYPLLKWTTCHKKRKVEFCRTRV